MASPLFLGCPLKLNDAGGRSLSSVLSDKCTVNRTMRDPDLPQSRTKQPVTLLEEGGGSTEEDERGARGQPEQRAADGRNETSGSPGG